MSSGERVSPEHLLERMTAFCKLQPSDGVSNYVLEGPIQQGDRILHAAAGLFPPAIAGRDPGITVVTHAPKNIPTDATYYYSRILHLVLSERIKELGVPDIPYVRDLMINACRLNGLPMVTFTFGKYRDTDLSFIHLHTVIGLSPGTALADFKVRAQGRINSYQ